MVLGQYSCAPLEPLLISFQDPACRGPIQVSSQPPQSPPKSSCSCVRSGPGLLSGAVPWLDFVTCSLASSIQMGCAEEVTADNLCNPIGSRVFEAEWIQLPHFTNEEPKAQMTSDFYITAQSPQQQRETHMLKSPVLPPAGSHAIFNRNRQNNTSKQGILH